MPQALASPKILYDVLPPIRYNGITLSLYADDAMQTFSQNFETKHLLCDSSVTAPTRSSVSMRNLWKRRIAINAEKHCLENLSPLLAFQQYQHGLET